MRPVLDLGLLSLGQDYSVFPTISPTRIAYASHQAAGGAGCPTSSPDEEFVTMIGGLAAFCVVALPWLGWRETDTAWQAEKACPR